MCFGRGRCNTCAKNLRVWRKGCEVVFAFVDTGLLAVSCRAAGQSHGGQRNGCSRADIVHAALTLTACKLRCQANLHSTFVSSPVPVGETELVRPYCMHEQGGGRCGAVNCRHPPANVLMLRRSAAATSSSPRAGCPTMLMDGLWSIPALLSGTSSENGGYTATCHVGRECPRPT